MAISLYESEPSIIYSRCPHHPVNMLAKLFMSDFTVCCSHTILPSCNSSQWHESIIDLITYEHSAGRALTSDWSVNSLTMRKNVSGALDRKF